MLVRKLIQNKNIIIRILRNKRKFFKIHNFLKNKVKKPLSEVGQFYLKFLKIISKLISQITNRNRFSIEPKYLI